MSACLFLPLNYTDITYMATNNLVVQLKIKGNCPNFNIFMFLLYFHIMFDEGALMQQ